MNDEEDKENVQEHVQEHVLSDDSEYEDDNNETPPPGVTKEFRDIILTAKESLYDSIIFGPKLETPDAQSLQLLQIYMDKLNEFYKLTNSSGDITKKLEIFPIQSRDSIQKAVTEIQTFFRINTAIQDRIPYENYLNHILKKYQFVFKKKGEVE